MGNPFQFYIDEREAHRVGLGIYAGTTAYKKASDNPDNPNVKWVHPQCDNVNLVYRRQGGYCLFCQHYHWMWRRMVDGKPVPHRVWKRCGSKEPGAVERVIQPITKINAWLKASYGIQYDDIGCLPSIELAKSILNAVRELFPPVVFYERDVTHETYRVTHSGKIVTYGHQAILDDQKSTKQIVQFKVWQAEPSMDPPEPTRLNVGKYESNWTLVDDFGGEDIK